MTTVEIKNVSQYPICLSDIGMVHGILYVPVGASAKIIESSAIASKELREAINSGYIAVYSETKWKSDPEPEPEGEEVLIGSRWEML